jgi:carbonic anhydrase
MPDWSYGGETGPDRWADLCADWSIARKGKEQSPIDISGARMENLPPIEFNYRSSSINIINTGHTIQVNCDAGSSVEIEGETFNLVQFHFHAPSEHSIEGQFSELELHFVHASPTGSLAVVGVMIDSGMPNMAFAEVWKHLPHQKGEEQHHKDLIDLDNLLPRNRSYYHYPGSLTTPPCSEGVRWYVLSEPVALSPEQVKAYTDIHSGTNRPIQALHGRTIVKSN